MSTLTLLLSAVGVIVAMAGALFGSARAGGKAAAQATQAKEAAATTQRMAQAAQDAPRTPAQAVDALKAGRF